MRWRGRQSMNSKWLGENFPATFDARSADSTGLKMRRITRAVSLPDASCASDRKDSTPRHGRLLHPSSWAERDDRDHAAENFFQGGSPKTGHPIFAPGPPHRQKSFLTKFPGMGSG